MSTTQHPTGHHDSYSLVGDNLPLDRSDWLNIAGSIGCALAVLACAGLAFAYFWQWVTA